MFVTDSQADGFRAEQAIATNNKNINKNNEQNVCKNNDYILGVKPALRKT